MTKKTSMLQSVIYSGIAGVVSPFILQAVADLPAEKSIAAGLSVFVLALIASGLVALGNKPAEKEWRERRPGRQRNGVHVVDEDEEDHRELGTVKWFNVTKGFGFITRDSGDDVFVHFRSIRGTGHRSLTEGQRVRFEVVQSEKGLQAEDVSVVRS